MANSPNYRGNQSRKLEQSSAKTYPVTFRLMARLQTEMQTDVVKRGYGLKGKSQWGREAIEGFLQDPSWKEQVLETEVIGGHDEKDVFYLTSGIRTQLADALNEVMRYAIQSSRDSGREELINSLKISTSSIIRAAINWRVYGLKMTRVSDLNMPLPFESD